MRRRALGGIVRAVEGEHDGLIQIELRLDGALPTGTATRTGCGPREFTGWMGLMSAVDALADDTLAVTGEDER